MAKDIKKRIDDSFATGDRADLLTYMEWLRSSMTDLSQQLRRSAGLALLLIAAFGLVEESPKTTITIGSFQLSSGSVVLVFIPGLVAYLYLQAVDQTTTLDSVQIAFTEALSKWSAEAEKNDLDLLAFPSMALYWSSGVTNGYTDNRSWLESFKGWTSSIILIVVQIGVFAFEGLAYYKLYRGSALHNIPWIISLCFAVSCLMAGLVEIFADEIRIGKYN